MYVNVDQFGMCTNHQVFYSAVRSTSAGLQSWNCRGLVDFAVRANFLFFFSAFLLGPNFKIGEQLSVECCASTTMQRISVFSEIQ